MLERANHVGAPVFKTKEIMRMMIFDWQVFKKRKINKIFKNG